MTYSKLLPILGLSLVTACAKSKSHHLTPALQPGAAASSSAVGTFRRPNNSRRSRPKRTRS